MSRLLTASVLEDGSNAVIPNWAEDVARICAESGRGLTAELAVSGKALATPRAKTRFLQDVAQVREIYHVSQALSLKLRLRCFVEQVIANMYIPPSALAQSRHSSQATMQFRL